MIFKRVKIKGHDQKLFRTWKSEEKYRVTWVKEFMRVTMKPHFHACVRIRLPDGREMWDFAGRHSPYKTYKAAIEACEKHCRLWTKIIKVTGTRQIKELCGKIPLGYPLWVRKNLNGKLRAVLEDAGKPRRRCDDQDDLIETPENTCPVDSIGAPTSGKLRGTKKNGPASSAKDADGTMTQTAKRARSKATECVTDSPAKIVKARGRGRKPKSSKPTKRKSTSIRKKRASTKLSSKRTKSPSQS